MKLRYALAIVEWDDACVHWGEQEAVVHEPVLQRSAGWLVQQDEKGVSLAYTFSEDTGPDDQLFIPAGMVRRVIVVKRKGANA